MFFRRSIVSAAVVLAAASIVVTRPALARDGQMKPHTQQVYTPQQEARDTFSLLADQSAALRNRTDEMHQAANKTLLDRTFRVDEATDLKAQINTMGRELAELTALAPDETAVQRRLVARATTELGVIGTAASSIITYLNRQPQQLPSQEYAALTARLAGEADQLHKLLHDAVKLAKVRQEQQQLQQEVRGDLASRD